MTVQPQPWLPGSAPRKLPLARLLPPFQPGMADAWLRARVPAGSWVLDPLGASPPLAVEAARAGYRVLVTTHNPILRFITEVHASSPTKKELQAVLSALAILRRGDTRLEAEIKSLYETRCRKCNALVQAEAYLWERDAAQPYACLYRCPECNDEGEHPPTEFDLDKLRSLTSHSLHYARALERVNVGDEAAHQGAEAALKTILPRQLTVISTLINKTATLRLSREEKQLLHALILSVCDQGNVLYAWPSARSRPRQLTIPPRFRENNLWTAFETAIDEWASSAQPVPVTHWPELPPGESGICLYPGRPGTLLTEANANLSFQAMLSVLPRPSQAFWTYSALWAGWLWGHEAVQPMKSALKRQRYDWNWYAGALFRLFSQLESLPPFAPFFHIIPELTQGFLEAVMLSSGTANLQLRGLALNEGENIAQLTWQTVNKLPIEIDTSFKSVIQNAMLAHLQERGEPTRLLPLELSGLAELPFQNFTREFTAGKLLNKTQNTVQELLEDPELFLYDEDPDRPQTQRTWWPAGGFNTESRPLADRVEYHILETLINAPVVKEDELLSDLNSAYPGLLTPPTDLVSTILTSYAFAVSQEPAVWQINEQEQPSSRQADVQSMKQELSRLGKELNYHVEVDEQGIWWSDHGKRKFVYHCFASSMIWRFVQHDLPDGCHGVLVFPGSRSRLLTWKLDHNPLLAQAVHETWHMLKFRHLRSFLKKGTPSRARWMEHLEMDPPLWEEAKQMTFFG